MIADSDGRIVYANEAVAAMLRALAAEIRTQLPHFDPDKVVGAGFDSFLTLASPQRSLRATLQQEHAADIRLGGASLRIIATPIATAAGARLGTVVQWLDRSAEVAIDDEVRLVVAAAGDGDLTRRIRGEGKTGFSLL